jgi:hypothetical protein
MPELPRQDAFRGKEGSTSIMSPLERLEVVSRNNPANSDHTNWALQAAAALVALLMILAFAAA